MTALIVYLVVLLLNPRIKTSVRLIMSMEAALYHGPDKGITVGTTPKPTPWKGEPLVKIEAAGDVQICISGQV